jgi:hypothetical protein
MLNKIVKVLNNSTFVVGIMMLILNVASRHIVHEFSDDDEEYRQNIILRRVAVFAVCFVGTRNIIQSLVLTAAFVTLASGMYHTKSIFAREGMTNEQVRIAGIAVVAAPY